MKTNKYFKKWITPICILIFLLIVIFYSRPLFTVFNDETCKEGLGSCKSVETGDFHNPISYSKFETLSKSDKKTYKKAFNALNSYNKDSLSMIELKKRSDKFQLSKNKSWLKWILKSGTITVFKINDESLKPMSKCENDSFTTLTEGFSSDDKIKLTVQDLIQFSNNNLLDISKSDKNYSAIADPNNSVSIYTFIYGSTEQNVYNKINLLIDLLKSKNAVAYICTAESDPPDFTAALSKVPLSGTVIETEMIPKDYRNTLIYAIDYVVNTRLLQSDPNDPYFNFEMVHENLKQLSKNVIDGLKGDSKNKLYCWMGSQ